MDWAKLKKSTYMLTLINKSSHIYKQNYLLVHIYANLIKYNSCKSLRIMNRWKFGEYGIIVNTAFPVGFCQFGKYSRQTTGKFK